MRTKNIAYMGVLTSVALILSYLERLLPPIVPVPGVKLGLANLAVLTAMYLLSNKSGLYLSIIKCTAVAILFGGLSSFMYSTMGALFSYTFMYLFRKMRVFTVVGVSIIGGVMHNLGQITMAIIIIGNIKLLYYFPILIISGIISGVAIGLVCLNTLNYLKVINK